MITVKIDKDGVILAQVVIPEPGGSVQVYPQDVTAKTLYPPSAGGGGNGQAGGGGNGQTGGGGNGQTGGGGNGQTGGHAPYPAFAPAHHPRTRIISSYRIRFRIEQQEQSEWCWAAVAASLAKFFDPCDACSKPTLFQQCQIAKKVLTPPQDCCANPIPCNKPQVLAEVLNTIGVWRTTLDRPLTFDEVRQEIDADRPVCVRIEWPSGGGHAVVIRGYRVLASGALQVYVADPLYPSSLVDFDEFTFSYYGDGKWAETELLQSWPVD